LDRIPFWLLSAARTGSAVNGEPDLLVRDHCRFQLRTRSSHQALRDVHSGSNGRRVMAIVAGWLCVASICALRAETSVPGNVDLGNPDVIAMGKKRFNRTCFYCHGYEGVGGKGATLQRRSDLTPEVIFNTISNGRIRGSAVMPPWKNSLTEEETWQLVAYILSLREMPEPK
jgi:mono/diheme cytochrome c family protein